MISDFRHNPFTDVSTATTLTETHIIPFTSPYVVTLGEVPQKDSPSTMTVKEVTLPIGETVSYGVTFSEVAATPSTGEFFPDYNTGANGDKTWNTGKILFSANDAGKVVEITYTATGTLASVKANHFIPWWTDRGDGSDGIFHPTADVTISGEKNYTYCYIPEGVTVTVAPYALFKVQGAFINYGKITATGQGAKGGKGGYNYVVSSSFNGDDYDYYGVVFKAETGDSGIASEGGAGYGGTNVTVGSIPTFNGAPLLAEKEKIEAIFSCRGAGVGSGGSGGAGGGGNSGGSYRYGGTGGNGGGAVAIVATSILINGTIEANGSKAPSFKGEGGPGGGGGGGSITLIANNIKNIGTMTVTGGEATGSSSAAGGNGIIIIKELGAD